jgi:NADH-quinone oxidoreductase subunit M
MDMMLILLIAVFLVGGLFCWLVGRFSPLGARLTALAAAALNLGLAGWVWLDGVDQLHLWEVRLGWIPDLGIQFLLGMDGLSLLMVALTAFVGFVSVLISFREIHERVGLFHACLLWVLAGVNGVFLAQDLFLFYVFWEVMLVPMYFLIGVWGHERRIYAAVKFFLFTQLSGLLMLVSIIGLYLLHGRQTGVYTFEAAELMGTSFAPGVGMLLMLGFFAAFAVKLPAVGVHTWLPDAHGEAPTAGSVILAGLLLKTGAYGLIRFVLPLFPADAHSFAPVGMLLGVAGILYGAWLAFAQTDLKRMVAYTSVSHMGFVLLGVFTFNQLALQGAVMQMVCHAMSTGALFILAGFLQERLHTRDIGRMGGLWSQAPRMGVLAMFFAMASLGLPGLGNFVAEFLVVLGAFKQSIPLSALALVGVVIATVYSLWMIQRIFHGSGEARMPIPDLSFRETTALLLMVAVVLWLGLYPRPVLETTEQVTREVITAGGSR